MRRGERVGLLLDKSLEALVGVYGVIEAGAAYVPLESSPGRPARVHRGQRRAAVLITGDRKAGSCGELLREGPARDAGLLDGEARRPRS